MTTLVCACVLLVMMMLLLWCGHRAGMDDGSGQIRVEGCSRKEGEEELLLGCQPSPVRKGTAFGETRNSLVA